jgi:hypothetical protein
VTNVGDGRSRKRGLEFQESSDCSDGQAPPDCPVCDRLKKWSVSSAVDNNHGSSRRSRLIERLPVKRIAVGNAPAAAPIMDHAFPALSASGMALLLVSCAAALALH